MTTTRYVCPSSCSTPSTSQVRSAALPSETTHPHELMRGRLAGLPHHKLELKKNMPIGRLAAKGNATPVASGKNSKFQRSAVKSQKSGSVTPQWWGPRSGKKWRF